MSVNLGPVNSYYKIRRHGYYPWPWEGDKDRTLEIFESDMLVRERKDRYKCITGICCVNIHIPDTDVILVKGDKRHLVMM